MHRSSTRRDEGRSIERRALPPGKSSFHGGVDGNGDDTPSTETFQRMQPGKSFSKKDKEKARPLNSSTNRVGMVPGSGSGLWPGPDHEDAATRLPSAPSQWKMSRARSPMPGDPSDENDDWILNQEAPSMPPVAGTERARSRTRTTSAGGSKNKARAEEKKSRSFLTQDDTTVDVAHSRQGEQSGLRTRRNTDAQAEPTLYSASQDGASSLRRRRSWGRNKDVPQPTAQESNSKRITDLDPDLKRGVVSGGRGTRHKTASGQGVAEAEKNTARDNDLSGSYARSGQTSSLSLATTRTEAKASQSVSPLPREHATMGSRGRYDRSREHTYSDETDTMDNGSFIHQTLATVEHVDDDHEVARSRRHIEPRSRRSSTLKAPQISTRSQSLSPNVDADDPASEPALRIPRVRSSSKSQASPLLTTSTSPARAPSGIPTHKSRTRSSSAAMGPQKSPSLPPSLPPKSPNAVTCSLSPALPSDKPQGSPRPQRSHSNYRDGVASRLPSRSPRAYGGTGDNETPKASRNAWRRNEQSSTESDSAYDEKLRIINRCRSGQSQFHQPNEKFSLKSARDVFRDKSSSITHRERTTFTAPNEDPSDFSGYENPHEGGPDEDSHLRRKNELADIVAGLNLNLGQQNDHRILLPGRRNSRRDVPQDHSEESPCHEAVGIAMGGSSESDALRDNRVLPDEAHCMDQRQPDIKAQDRQLDQPSRQRGSQTRSSLTPQPRSAGTAPAVDVGETSRLLEPDSSDVNRDSLLMLNSDRQREAFGIPSSVSGMHEGSEELLSADSNMSLKEQTLDSDWEGAPNDGLGLSHGAAQLFHALGIGAAVQQNVGYASERQRTSWRSSMAEAEKYLSESLCPPGVMSASSSHSSIYEDDVPERPWQRRERDLDRAQSGSSVKSSWRKTLSQSAFNSLLERHGEAEMRRQEVIWELCETEQTFLKSLRTALKVFAHPLLGKNRAWVSGLPSNVSRLLDWLEDIFQLHAQISSALQRARSLQYPIVLRIAETLRSFVPMLEVYQPYIVRLDEVVEEIEEILKDPSSKLGEFFRIQSLEEECAGMSFSAFLWLPLTRLGKYLKHFNELWSLTPRSHVDHLPTFSLLHSTTMVVRVMREVKLREEEYAFAKELLSQVQGFPNLNKLVRRERRLIAHGALQRVHVSERTRDKLEGNSYIDATPNVPHVQTRRMTHRRRANSLDSCLSEAASISSMSSVASASSLNGEIDSGGRFPLNTPIQTRGGRLGKQLGANERINGVSHDKTRTTEMYAFVFTDLAIFAMMVPRRSNDGKGQNTLELLDDIGVCRVLSIADHSGNLGYDHLTGVQVLPMDVEHLDGGILPDASPTSVFIHLPGNRRGVQQHSEARKRWWLAFEQCYHSTLRSISFPAHSGKYLSGGQDTGQDENTRQTIMAILASGLPLPKSPSVQIGELEKSAANDASTREREERGWWALRFQQILHEMKRDELPVPSIQMTTTLPVQPTRRKTVSGRRRLKLAGGGKQ